MIQSSILMEGQQRLWRRQGLGMRYTKKTSLLDADLSVYKNTTVLWEFLSDYHNALDVANFPGNCYCK